MAGRDYYQVLGVSRSATAEQVRSAYRKLARQYHPDVNKSPDAARSFTEVQQAYDVLSDEHKRRQYDQFGAAGPFAGAGAREHAPPSGGSAPFDFDADEIGSVFEAIFGSGNRGTGRQGHRSRARTTQPGGPFGFGEEHASEPMHQEVRVDFLTVVRGGTQSFRVIDESGHARTIEVRIPAGIGDGQQLRVRAGAGRSDFILVIRVLPHEVWRRGEGADSGQGLDLFFELSLTIAEATLGASLDIPTLTGRATLTVPPGSPSGRKLRLRGLGIRADDGRTGDLVAVVQVVPPSADRLSEVEKAALRSMSERGTNPRSGAHWRSEKSH